MNAEETIQAAINMLEAFKESSTHGDWAIQDGGDRFIAWHEDPASTGFDYIIVEPIEFENPVDAALIETLHRTIDAQLAILRGYIGTAEYWDKVRGTLLAVLALARAILGEAS